MGPTSAGRLTSRSGEKLRNDPRAVAEARILEPKNRSQEREIDVGEALIGIEGESAVGAKDAAPAADVEEREIRRERLALMAAAEPDDRVVEQTRAAAVGGGRELLAEPAHLRRVPPVDRRPLVQIGAAATVSSDKRAAREGRRSRRRARVGEVPPLQ